MDDSGGAIGVVSDDEIAEAYQLIAAKEGLFVEPASAASVAGLLKHAKTKKFDKDEEVVCVLTGHGLKDPSTAERLFGQTIKCEASLASVADVMGISLVQ